MKKETQRDLSKQIQSLQLLRSNAIEEKDTAELKLCIFEYIGNTLEIKETIVRNYNEVIKNKMI